MPEWWTYGLGDFLLFSPRTYYRLIERYNAASWPLHLVGAAAGLSLLALHRRITPLWTRVVCAVLAAAWGWVGWAFLWRRYATINWAAEYFAWGFAAEAVLLAGGCGPSRPASAGRAARDRRQRLERRCSPWPSSTR